MFPLRYGAASGLKSVVEDGGEVLEDKEEYLAPSQQNLFCGLSSWSPHLFAVHFLLYVNGNELLPRIYFSWVTLNGK